MNDPGRTSVRPPGATPNTPADPDGVIASDGAGVPAPAGYEILGLLDRGGMGAVYKARDARVNRVVALKVMLAGRHAGPESRVRFLVEAEAVAAVGHPGVVALYEFGEWDGQPFFALEFCPGGTLSRRLSGTPLPPRDAADLVARLADAVAAAHAKGIVHRDLKPANVLFGADGSPKVSDFGLAKMAGAGDGLTRTGAVMGTPSYMAPEQVRETRDAGPAADVWALGAVLYECLTGRPPFRGSSDSDTLMQVVTVDPVPVRALTPAVPVDLETVCLKCLEKEPGRRYESAAGLAADLRRWLAGQPVLARAVGPVGRARKWVGRNPVVAGLLAAVVVAVAAGTAGTYAKYLDVVMEREEAERLGKAAGDEADAKRRALGQLEGTFADLQKVSTQQAETVKQLAREKAATETMFLQGLLRPLHNRGPDARDEVGLVALNPLAELAAIPEGRVRAGAFEAGLAMTGGARRLSGWRREVVFAVVGMDRATAAVVCDRLRPALSDPTAAEGQLAAAAWVAELPVAPPEINLSAARVVATRLMSETDPLALSDLSEALAVLLGRVGQADAGSLALPPASRLVDRLAAERAYDAARLTADALVALADRLGPGEAELLSRQLASGALAERDPFLLAVRADGLRSLVRRLEPLRASAVTRPLFLAVSERLRVEIDPLSLVGLAAAFEWLADRAEPTDAADVAARYASTAAERMSAERTPVNLHDLAKAYSVLAGRLPPAGVSPVAGPFARAVAQRLSTERDAGAVSVHAMALAALGPRLSPADAPTLAQTVTDRLTAEDNPAALHALASALASLTDRMEFDTQVTATRVAAAAVNDKLKAVQGTAAAMDLLFAPLTDKVGARLAVDLTGAQSNTDKSSLGMSLALLARGLARDDASRLTADVGNVMGGTSQTGTYLVLAEALVALSDRSDPARVGPVLAQQERHSYRQLTSGQLPPPAVSAYASAFAVLARRLDAPDVAPRALAVARVVSQALAVERDASDRQRLAASLGAVVEHVRDADLLGVLKDYGYVQQIRRVVLDEFERRLRGGSDSARVAAFGSAGAVGAPRSRLSVWDFVTRAETLRPDLDLRSRPTRP